MEWLASFPDISPIEHLWDYVDRQVAALRSLNEPEEMLLLVWVLLFLSVSNNLIDSMESRKGEHIPY